ncbi:MAG: GTPase RsgA [Peptococcaceae bacterium BICA1-7]|nr:MAG: GTPase RsgA [Peptococcaceae bacterium BICA1-7]HBV99534.1 ribosome small subunit-dependent GTPase A [Desulfotomaculum sp.]
MASSIKGVVTKAYGGFYYVGGGGETLQCTLRGVLKHRKVDVRVGDRVTVLRSSGGAVVEEVFPRKNTLVRPPVANVDRMIMVFAVKDPDPSLILLDRFLIQSWHEEVEPVICFNKTDLLQEKEMNFINAYISAGYKVLLTSTRNGLGIQTLSELLLEGITVFAGPSGVGKSSLLNAVQPGLSLKTGEIGQKIKRGKHTTRHVELIPLENGGLVADTPGFSTLHLPEIEKENLCFYYPEMESFISGCRFTGCLHRSEPNCAVKEAVSGGKIDPGRYGRYLEILKELIEREGARR